MFKRNGKIAINNCAVWRCQLLFVISLRLWITYNVFVQHPGQKCSDPNLWFSRYCILLVLSTVRKIATMKKSDINLQTYGLLVFRAPLYHTYESRLTLAATVCDSRKNNLYAGWKKQGYWTLFFRAVTHGFYCRYPTKLFLDSYWKYAIYFSSCILLMMIKYHNPAFQLIVMALLFLVLPDYDFKLMIISNNNSPVPFYHALHLWDSVLSITTCITPMLTLSHWG